MARPVLTDEQVATFRHRACEVAMQLFDDEGYEHFSLRSLARELECSHATPYRYFDDKAEIFAVVRAEGFRRFERFLCDRLAGVGPPLDRLRVLGHAYLDFASSQSAAFTVIFEMGQPIQSEYPFVAKAAADAWGVLLGCVRESVEAGLLRGDVGELAHVMWAGVHGVASLELAHKLSMGRSGSDIVDAMVTALIAAHRATPTTLRQAAPRRSSTPRSTSSGTKPRPATSNANKTRNAR